MIWAADFFKAVPWRLFAVAGLVLVIAGAGWRISQWADAYDELPEVRAALELEQSCGEGSSCLERQRSVQLEQAIKVQEVMQGYEDELLALRTRPVGVRTVRVCPDAGASDLSGRPAAGPAHGASAAAGMGDEGARPDIGPELYAIAARCDEVTAQARGLQGWAESISTPEAAP